MRNILVICTVIFRRSLRKLPLFDFAFLKKLDGKSPCDCEKFKTGSKSLFLRLRKMPMLSYTKQQLALRNGQDKPEIWVAFEGLIYDVTDSRLWRNGKHYEHWAGQDLTEELADAPHTAAVFEKFTVIGKLGA